MNIYKNVDFKDNLQIKNNLTREYDRDSPYP